MKTIKLTNDEVLIVIAAMTASGGIELNGWIDKVISERMAHSIYLSALKKLRKNK